MKKKYEVCYDLKKRTAGGFVDALFLCSIIITGFVWVMLLIIEKG